jgi:TldD protein
MIDTKYLDDFEKISEIALNTAKSKGASYTDIRISQIKDESLSTKNGASELIQNSESIGFGLRVIYNGSWGFASSCDFDEKNIKRIALLAIQIAKASSKLKEKNVALSPLSKTLDSYNTPIKIDPFSVPLREKLEYLLSLDNLLSKVSGINIREAFMAFRKEEKFFASSEGSKIDQKIIYSGAGISATAMKSHKEMGKRSYPNSSGQYETKGYELVSELKLEENAGKIGNEALALLKAKECPQGVKTIILDGAQVSLQIHESIGHPLELDRVFGAEKNFSGTSFATTDKLDKLKYGSEIVNVVTDPSYPGGLGTFGYDDEGGKAERSYLIKDGILVGYLTSRETASLINRKSNASMRAESWGDVPIIRMTNTILLPGKHSLEDMISEVDDGIYMETVSSWSIDDNRENFKMGCEIGWEIKNGKLGGMIKKPTYSGNTVDFWNSCDAIANEKYFKIWGTPNCGKGQPAQNIATGQGASPCRFGKVKVGE